jgi:hypothetical protein
LTLGLGNKHTKMGGLQVKIFEFSTSVLAPRSLPPSRRWKTPEQVTIYAMQTRLVIL